MMLECVVGEGDTLEVSTSTLAGRTVVSLAIRIMDWEGDSGEISELFPDGAQHVMEVSEVIDLRDELTKLIRQITLEA